MAGIFHPGSEDSYYYVFKPLPEMTAFDLAVMLPLLVRVLSSGFRGYREPEIPSENNVDVEALPESARIHFERHSRH